MTDAAKGWAELGVQGVLRRQMDPIGDSRGSFLEVWRATWTDFLPGSFQQANLSRSEAGVLRGMHFHERQADLWIVLEGRAQVAVVDLRAMIRSGAASPSAEQLTMEAGAALYIPAGVAHGFLALEPLALLYLVTNEYDGTDEHGFVWDDPTVGLSWELSPPTVSERDRSNPRIADAVREARQRGGLSVST